MTETWLKEHDLGQDLGIDGFGQPIRLDRDAQLTGKIQKHVLTKKKIAFQKERYTRKKETQRLVKNEIKLAKRQFKDKVEDKLKNGNAYCAWRGIKAMVGMSDKKKGIVTSDKPDSDLVEELNQFYLRFDSHEFNDDLAEFRIESEGSQISLDEIDVWKTLEQTSIRKSQGPDCIRLLKNCALFRNSIFTFIFQLSLSQRKVPGIWKESVVVPVAKIPSPKVLNDYRPVAVTSLVMKGFERIVRKSLLCMTQSMMDPLQFAYLPSKGVEDATATLLCYWTFRGQEDTSTLVFCGFFISV